MQVVPANIYLTREERKLLMKKNDLIAFGEILIHYTWIAIAFALVYFFANPITIVVSLFILGGKQLSCAILMHDTGHKSVFKNQKLNDFIGQWFGAYPIFNNMKPYRAYHFEHHNLTGLEDDPDLLLTRGYPTSSKSMLRKFLRDFTGITGIKAFIGLTLINFGFFEYNMGGKIIRIPKEKRSISYHASCFKNNLLGPIIANLIMFMLLWFIASPWLYLLWVIAYLTTFQFCIRVRSIAEHSVVEDATDPYKNTRTTKANWLEKMLFAPYHVNYHVEHHMLMSVPSYNLPKMHKTLLKKGFYEKGVLANGYWSVIKLAASGRGNKKSHP